MKSKISITAEFASLIKSELDQKNLYFVSKSTRIIVYLLGMLLPKKLLRNIYFWRLELSKIFDSIIEKESAEQVIELGAGYSLRGLTVSQKNRNLVYIDSDYEDVVLRKEEVVTSMCQKEGCDVPLNLHFLGIDVLTDDFFSKIKNHVLPSSKTLIIAEGLTSYFTIEEFRTFLKKVQSLHGHLPNAIFYSHERFVEPKGMLYKILRRVLSFFTHSQKGHRFKTQGEFVTFLNDSGIKECTLDDSNPAHLIYSFKI